MLTPFLQTPQATAHLPFSASLSVLMMPNNKLCFPFTFTHLQTVPFYTPTCKLLKHILLTLSNKKEEITGIQYTAKFPAAHFNNDYKKHTLQPKTYQTNPALRLAVSFPYCTEKQSMPWCLPPVPASNKNNDSGEVAWPDDGQ